MNTDLDKVRQLVEKIRAHLPSSISVGALGVQSKAPYLLLAAREALIWRTEELARCACDMLERDDLAAGILLTRAVTESAAFVCRLNAAIRAKARSKRFLTALSTASSPLLLLTTTCAGGGEVVATR